ncbi:fibronectin type III domain-containing protein [Nakamurella sp. GG22]
MAWANSACGAVVRATATDAGLRFTQVTDTSALLSWTKPSTGGSVEGYRIYRGAADVADDRLALIETVDPSTAYRAVQLRSGHRYKFGVAAIDVHNNEFPIRVGVVTTAVSKDRTPPDPVPDGSLVVKPFSHSRIDIDWGRSPSSDLSYYEVSRDGVLVGSVERPFADRYSDNNLSPSSTHSYTVTAIDSAGNRSAATVAKSATTLAPGTSSVVRGPVVSDVTGDSAVVSWWTNIPTTGSVSVNGASFEDESGAVQHHQVTLTGLSAGRQYPYTVSDGASGSFWTAAGPGAVFSFAAIGDFGTGSPSQEKNAENIAAAGTQFVQTLGDNVYPSAGLPDADFTTSLSDFDNRFYDPMEPVLRGQAIFPANGNKEYYADGAFWEHIPMPGENHSWYSFTWGDAHIVVLDTELPFGPKSKQYAFLARDLAAHQAEKWRIVVFQRPPYSSTSGNSSSLAVQQYLVPLFQTSNVALVLSGNSHNYERTFPLINGAPVKSGGITYVVSGGGGNTLTAFTAPQPAWTAFRQDTEFEFAKVTVSPENILVEGVAADTAGTFDSATIVHSQPDRVAPSVPGNPGDDGTTASTTTLTWAPSTDNVAVAGYQVFRDSTDTPIATTSTATFTDTGLTPATTYAYYVQALDLSGNKSPRSATINVTTAASGAATSSATSSAPNAAARSDSSDCARAASSTGTSL